MKRCIRRRVEAELVNQYQKNAEPTKEVKRKLEKQIGEYIAVLCHTTPRIFYLS